MSRKGQDSFGEGGSVFRVPPYHYIHVQDQTSNVTRVEVGPLTFVSISLLSFIQKDIMFCLLSLNLFSIFVIYIFRSEKTMRKWLQDQQK